jgi:hypothetical protein
MFQEPQNFNSLFPPISFLVVGVYYVFKNVFFFNEKKIRISSSLRRAEVRALNLNPFFFLSPAVGPPSPSTGPPQRVRNNTSYKDRTDGRAKDTVKKPI